jgi:hypothetical protein
LEAFRQSLGENKPHRVEKPDAVFYDNHETNKTIVRPQTHVLAHAGRRHDGVVYRNNLAFQMNSFEFETDGPCHATNNSIVMKLKIRLSNGDVVTLTTNAFGQIRCSDLNGDTAAACELVGAAPSEARYGMVHPAPEQILETIYENPCDTH